MTDKKQKEQLWDPWDGEYIGNIWGWKFSFFSLFFLVALILLMWYRFESLDKSPFPLDQQITPTEQNDTIG
jgi:Arabinose efflux permease